MYTVTAERERERGTQLVLVKRNVANVEGAGDKYHSAIGAASTMGRWPK